MKKESQDEKILRYLQNHDGISQKIAIEQFQCYRLSARIYNLRKRGHVIRSEIRSSKNSTFAFYSLVE